MAVDMVIGAGEESSPCGPDEVLILFITVMESAPVDPRALLLLLPLLPNGSSFASISLLPLFMVLEAEAPLLDTPAKVTLKSLKVLGTKLLVVAMLSIIASLSSLAFIQSHNAATFCLTQERLRNYRSII
jgi:hypothetical protein